MPACNIASQRAQALLYSGSLFENENAEINDENELCVGLIEKSVPQDHRLSLLGKPRDAKR